MKNNFLKYLFFIFVIGIIIFAVYKINKKDKAEVIIEEEKITKEEDVVREFKLGIAEFDNINPIISNNKYVQDISKLIFNSLLSLDDGFRLKSDLAQEWAKVR